MKTVMGPHFTVGPSFASFFDASGTRVDADTWSFTVEGGEHHYAIEPAYISPTIRCCIKIDERKGVGDRIAQLHLNMKAGVFFSLEGYLTPEAIYRARDQLDVHRDVFIRIPGIVFDGRRLAVVVYRELECDVRTADEWGYPI